MSMSWFGQNVESYSDIPSHGFVKMWSRILILHSTFVSLNIKF